MTDSPADPPADATPHEHLGFLDWIKRIPTTYALLAAAISAAVGLFAPERLLPEPLVPFRFLASLIVVVAFVLTWAWRTALRRHLRVIATVTAALLLVLGTLNVLFVRQVSYQNPAEERYVLVGLTLADEDLRGMSDQDVVRQVGSEFSALRGAYGPHFVLVVLAYALCYLLLVQSVILSLGGSELAQPRRRGPAFDLLGRPDSSLAYLRRSLATSVQAGQRSFAALTLINMGRVQLESRRPDSALLTVRQGLAIKREVGDLTGQSWGLNDLGQVHLALGQPDSAVADYRAALALLRRTGDRAREGRTLFHLANAFHRRRVGRDLRVATSYYDSASALRGETSRQSGGDADRLSFAEQDVGLYEEWALAWLARSDEVGAPAAGWAALAAAEQGRARALLDLMRGAPAQGPELPTGRDLAAEGRGWGAAIDRSGAAAALVYLVTRDTLVLWVVRPPGEVSVLRVAVPRDTLAARVRNARAAFAPDDRCERAPAPSGRVVQDAVRALSELLLPPPARALLPEAGELLVLPHGPLNLVPFAALPLGAPDRALGLRYALRYAPSLSTMREADERPGLGTGLARAAALRRALVVGNPRMPKVRFCDVEFTPSPLVGAERSSRGIAEQLGAGVLIGRDATERAVRRLIAQASVVHLETHGFAYETDALARASFVVLAPGPEAEPTPADDGLLTVGEVLDELPTLSADLIVLSACQTGLGNLKEAEGTVGLQRAFLAKRARSVLVSLWNVSDEATALLMGSFYRQWLAEPQSGKAEALRRAEAELQRRAEFANPRYWAAFQLAGAR